jgi:hypothetical protein
MTLPVRVMIRSNYRNVQTCALQVDSSRHSVARQHGEPLWLARGLRDALPMRTRCRVGSAHVTDPTRRSVVKAVDDGEL